MSFYFIANNLHFALELVGALVFLLMGWLAIDSYVVNKHYASLMRVLGFVFVGVWQTIHSFSLGTDIVNFFGFSVYLLGLVLLVLSFTTAPKMAAVSAVILLPSFSSTAPVIQTLAAILLGYISYLAYQQYKKEFNNSLRPLWIGFGFLTVSALFQTLSGAHDSESIVWYIVHGCEVVGFSAFAFWVWQYLKLRVRESLVLIFISMTVFIATVVTLAFSTILIGKIEQQTRNNLLINAKVFDFSVQGLSTQTGAVARLVAKDPKIGDTLSDENIPYLQTLLTSYLDTEKLGFLLVVDQSGIVVMRAHSPLQHGDSISTERSVEEALIGNDFSTIEFSSAEKFSIRSSSPIYNDGKVIGAVVAGFPLDNAMVDRIKKITGLDTTLYQDNLAIASTALAEDGRSRLIGVALEDNQIKDSVLLQGDSVTSRVSIKNNPYLASYLPIKNGDNEIVGMFSAAKPQADIIEIANATNRLTLVTVTVLLLLLAFPLYLVTRKLLGEI